MPTPTPPASPAVTPDLEPPLGGGQLYWRPIETAEIPGQWLLAILFDGERVAHGHWDGEEWFIGDECFHPTTRPTHWMPWPAPPHA